MKKLISLMFMMVLFISGVRADSIILDSGQVIPIPEGGRTCEYDKVYCPAGWKPDGSFPFEPWAKAFTDLINTCRSEARDYPLCPEGLVLGETGPCYKLMN